MNQKKIHLIAACGTGMGTLACMLKDAGHKVSGSDEFIYPPMSDFLKDQGIELFNGFNSENLSSRPDIVIIGNAVTKDNVEAKFTLDNNIPYLSMPQALNNFFARDKKVILVTGTHGKTTTASIMAHVLYTAGYDPSFMIGGILNNFNSSFHIGKGDYFVIEGDEYDTAFFDKGAKFMHFDPFITINTGIEFDHADIFSDITHIKEVFKGLLKKLKPSSLLIASCNSHNLDSILKYAPCPIEEYGSYKKTWWFNDYSVKSGKAFFNIISKDKTWIPVTTSMMGKHNAMNTTAAACASEYLNIPGDIFSNALATFAGIKRRQEIRGEKRGVTVMDDFAHHPSAVKETIAGVRPFYLNGRVLVVFEPGTNTSMRDIFQDVFPDSFQGADLVCIKEPSGIAKIPANERISAKKIVSDLNNKGIKALYFNNTNSIIDFVTKESKPGDLILIMSNKGFDNIHLKILNKL